MKIVIDIDENVFTRLFDNGVDTSPEDREVIDRAVRNGIPLPKERGRLIVLSEDKMKENQINLDFSFQKWISEVGLSLATVAVIEANRETKNE